MCSFHENKLDTQSSLMYIRHGRLHFAGRFTIVLMFYSSSLLTIVLQPVCTMHSQCVDESL